MEMLLAAAARIMQNNNGLLIFNVNIIRPLQNLFLIPVFIVSGLKTMFYAITKCFVCPVTAIQYPANGH